MPDIVDINWISDAEAITSLRCPICNSPGSHRAVLSVPHKYTGECLTLYRCEVCDACFYPDAIEYSYDESQGVSKRALLQQYVEVGAGLWAMLWPIALLHRGESKSLLDVGCGYGYSVDMWRTAFGDEAIGVEAAEWGQAGREQLDIPVFRGMLDEVIELQGRAFDIVYSCEVIEHVVNPRAFLRSLSAKLAPGGILVLTTPSSEFIRQGNDESDILAALSPGGHLFLLSPRSLAALLQEAGFTEVHVVSARERLIAYAGMQKIDLAWDRQEVQRHYLGYLGRRLERTPAGTPLYDGFAYRLFKELVLLGDMRNAAVLDNLLQRSLGRRFGQDLSPAHFVDEAGATESLEQWADKLPFFIGSYCYFKGELGRLSGMDHAEALEWLEASFEIALRALSISPMHFLESISWVWPAIDRSILLHLASNDATKALEKFELLTEALSGDAESFRGAKPQLVVVAQAAQKLMASLLVAGERTVLRRFASSVEQALSFGSTDERSVKALQDVAITVRQNLPH